MPEPKPVVTENKDGSLTFNYKPVEKGLHELALSFNDKSVSGTPFRCHVDSVGGEFVSAYGEGLNQATVGHETSFIVVGGGKDISVNVSGPNDVKITKKDAVGNGLHVTYLPVTPGEYNVDVKHKAKHIFGSPFVAKCTVPEGEGRKRSQLALPGTCEIVLGGHEVDLTNMIAVMKTPAGSAEPCLLKRTPTGQLSLASFAPKVKGRYTVDVTQDGKAVSGSPFSINVDDHKVACAGKVKVSGAGTKHAEANKANLVELDLSEAGHGPLAISVEGAHRSDLEHTRDQDKYTISYKPHEPGMYLLNVRFADDHVSGSPFMLHVGGEPSGRVRETVEVKIKEVEATGINSKCEFQLKIPGTNPLDMEAFLASPSGKTEMCEISDLAECLYDIKFQPAEEGVHTVSLKYKGLHCSGSPFQYTVGPAPNSGPYKVEIGGPGMEYGEVGTKNEFNIYTREAGAGHLKVSIEGPSKALLKVKDRGHGYCTASYVVTKQGDYGIHVKFNDEHVPDSPTIVYVAPESGDAKLCTVHGLRDRGLDINKAVTFNVNLNGAKGELKAYINTPSGDDLEVFYQEIDRHLWAVRFVPKENGVHYVPVKFNESHIPGSPFPFLVGKMGADPALVVASGKGLSEGEVGKQCKFQVQTVDAGAGVLNVQIEGSSKVAIQCTEIDEGYEFVYTPMAGGDYLINIKYSNITIAGMPTKATITGGTGKVSSVIEKSNLVIETVEKKPGAKVKSRFHGDASKVVAKGNGLKKAFVGRMSNFTIDVKGAGNALLSVGMITPKGMPVEELTVKRQRGTAYMVTYKTSEKGDHPLLIRWGQDDIPGSPFTVTA